MGLESIELARGRRVVAVAAVALLASLAGAPAGASPNILGTFTGDGTETYTGCSDPADNGTFPLTLTFAVTDQVGGAFSGTALGGGGGEPSDIAGVVDTTGLVTGSFSDSESAGTFTGTLAGDTLSLSFVGADLPPETCVFTGDVTMSRDGSVVNPENAPSSGVTSERRVQTAARAYSGAIGSRVSTFIRGGVAGSTGATALPDGFMLQGTTSGLSAGEGARWPLGVWGGYTRSDPENTFELTAFDSTFDLFIGGVDVSPVENVIVGVTLGVENANADTFFNAGKQKSKGVTLGPYFGALINDWLSIDGAATFTWTDFDQFRTDPTSGSTVSSSPDGHRSFITGGLNGTKAIDDWLFTARVGALWASDTVDAFQESDGTSVPRTATKLGQLRIGAEVAHAFTVFEPYVGAIFEYDYSRSGLTLSPGLPQPSDDDTGLVLNIGVRFYGSETLSGSLEFSRVLGRSDFEQDTFTFLLRGDF